LSKGERPPGVHHMTTVDGVAKAIDVSNTKVLRLGDGGC
jgi:hypothetical protein